MRINIVIITNNVIIYIDNTRIDIKFNINNGIKLITQVIIMIVLTLVMIINLKLII